MYVILVCQKVYRVAQRHAHYRRPRSDCDAGNAALNEPGQCQGEQCAVQYRAQYQEHGAFPLEYSEYEQDYDYEGYYRRGIGVAFYLTCVVNAHDRAAEIVERDAREFFG